VEVVVRPAEPGDASEVTALLDALVAEVGAERGGTELVGDHLDLVRTAVLDDLELGRTTVERRVVIGTVEGVVVGVAAARHRPADGGRRGVVECCYVEPAARRVGIGEALLAEVVDWLGSNGCGGVDGLALPGRRDAKSLFEAAGFKARLLVMHRSLGG
jgi:GNAT superfamily N-acetyltransferase